MDWAAFGDSYREANWLGRRHHELVLGLWLLVILGMLGLVKLGEAVRG